jgi:hypothetical protein
MFVSQSFYSTLARGPPDANLALPEMPGRPGRTPSSKRSEALLLNNSRSSFKKQAKKAGLLSKCRALVQCRRRPSKSTSGWVPHNGRCIEG